MHLYRRKYADEVVLLRSRSQSCIRNISISGVNEVSEKLCPFKDREHPESWASILNFNLQGSIWIWIARFSIRKCYEFRLTRSTIVIVKVEIIIKSQFLVKISKIISVFVKILVKKVKNDHYLGQNY